MKKSVLVLISFIYTATAIAQNDSLQAPYKRFPSFPPAKLLLPDNVSYFTKADLPKKKPVMLMVFSPSCEHCQHETEELINNIDKFKDIQIVMTTSMPFDSMLAYREKYRLERFKNIIVAQDTDYFLFTFYQVHNLPFLAFYDKKKELISVFEGGLPMDKILKVFH
ncbi:MAG: thioredoxin fold domain-containing protein [Bacteroidota bacterium]|nr:thioredoxin fold domain-containing protein [Bacteroidota bacterium]